MKHHVMLAIGLCLLAVGAQAEDVYPIDRRGGLPGNLWTDVGVQGGRPNVSAVFTNLTSGITLSQINAAIQRCPSNQVVQLGPGTYDFGGGQIELAKNGVVLRGATNAFGDPATFLSNVVVEMSSYWYPSGPSGGWPAKSVVPVTSGCVEGSTFITVGAPLPADFKVGDVFLLDQLDDGILVKPDTQADTYLRKGRSYCQPLQITGLSSSAIQFQPPLIGSYWSTNQSPEAVAWSSVLGPTTLRAGMENINLTKGIEDSIYTVRMGPAVDCWMYNVHLKVDRSAAVRLSYAVHCEITHSLFHDAFDVRSGTYATIPAVVTACKVEDNIFTNLSLAMPCISAVGCSFSYNFGMGPYRYNPQTWFAEYMFPHGGHTHHTLYEGNWLDGPIYFDNVFGNNNSDNGIVRNRINGWAPGKVANCFPVVLEEDMHDTTIVGNILGHPSFHQNYSRIYDIHPSSTGTLILNNYNEADAAINPAEDMGNQTLRDSYMYEDKPEWFGNLHWPPFDPTNVLALSGACIPAGYRSIYGVNPPAWDVPVVIADAQPRHQLTPPLLVQLTGERSYDPQGGAITHLWSFGDGESSTEVNPSHTYSAEGTYEAYLTVSDGTNSATTRVIDIWVGNRPPIVEASASRSTGPPPLNVSFYGSGSYDPDELSLTYEWSFGDGTTSTSRDATHTYNGFGQYHVTLTVSDGEYVATSSEILISVNTGLVAAYSFEEDSGPSTGDASGNNNTGLLINNPERVETGRFGRALLFNGRNSYVNVPHSQTLDIDQEITLMAWCFPTRITNGFCNLIYKPDDVYFLEGFTPVPNTPRFFGTFANSNLNATATLHANQWTHVAGTYDGSLMILYINGVKVVQQSASGMVESSMHDLGIGGNSLNGQYFPGMIDEVRIYSRALSAAEIQFNMLFPIQGLPTPPSNVQVREIIN